MDFDLKDFIQIERSPLRYNGLSEGEISLSPKSLGINMIDSKKMHEQQKAELQSRGEEPREKHLYMSVAYSPKHKAIMLKPDIDGFAFGTDKNGSARWAGIGRHLAKLQPTQGLYERDSDNPEIYVLVPDTAVIGGKELLMKYATEDTNIEEGDVVCWVASTTPQNHKFIASGIVRSINQNPDSKEMIIEIKPISRKYIESRKRKDNYVYMKTDNLIIREKHQ